MLAIRLGIPERACSCGTSRYSTTVRTASLAETGGTQASVHSTSRRFGLCGQRRHFRCAVFQRGKPRGRSTDSDDAHRGTTGGLGFARVMFDYGGTSFGESNRLDAGVDGGLPKDAPPRLGTP